MPLLTLPDQLLRLAARSALGMTALGTSGLVYATLVEPRWLDVQHIWLPLPSLDPAFDGYKIVQISDLHMDTGMKWDYPAEVIEVINAHGPDLVVITGDFVTFDVPGTGEEPAALLRQLDPRDATLGILGNHDYWGDSARVVELIAHSDIINVGNTHHTVERGDARLHIAGVNSVTERQADFNTMLGQLPTTGTALLLAHEPDFADISAATGRFALQLSGHSHGGQIRIPFYGDHLPVHGRRYPRGLYLVQEMFQYTNRGVGTIWPHLRFRCRPEITVFTLRTSAATDNGRLT